MRTCSRCGESKPLLEFPERVRGSGRRRSHCRSCKAQYQRDWYGRNKERHKEAVAQIRRITTEANQSIVRAAKDRPCADCGGYFPPYVLDLDHVRGEKVGNISRMVSGATQAAVRAEIAKCDVVCANCHRERTFGQAESAWHRRRTPWSSAADGDTAHSPTPESDQLVLRFDLPEP
jgi:hypothetical protein